FFGADTAIETSQESEYTISFSSIRAFTAGHSFNAIVTALVKKDIKPNPTPCFSLKASLYLARRSMIGCIFTSLKVVNIAVSFLTLTKRFAIVLRRDVIFSLRSLRAPATGAVAAGSAAGLLSAFGAAGFAWAFSASSFVIRPSLPVPLIVEGSIPFSLNILAAAGDAVPAAYESELLASSFAGAAVSSFVAGASSFLSAPPAGASPSSMVQTTAPISKVSPSGAMILRIPALSARNSHV